MLDGSCRHEGQPKHQDRTLHPKPQPDTQANPHLTQDRRLMDATAFLLERTGDVVGALQMLLAAITERAGTLR